MDLQTLNLKVIFATSGRSICSYTRYIQLVQSYTLNRLHIYAGYRAEEICNNNKHYNVVTGVCTFNTPCSYTHKAQSSIY